MSTDRFKPAAEVKELPPIIPLEGNEVQIIDADWYDAKHQLIVVRYADGMVRKMVANDTIARRLRKAVRRPRHLIGWKIRYLTGPKLGEMHLEFVSMTGRVV